jgi:hypothetical protein
VRQRPPLAVSHVHVPIYLPGVLPPTDVFIFETGGLVRAAVVASGRRHDLYVDMAPSLLFGLAEPEDPRLRKSLVLVVRYACEHFLDDEDVELHPDTRRLLRTVADALVSDS